MTAIQKTDGWLNNTRDGYSGANSPKITWVALGTDTTAPSQSDTQLGAEIFRKAVSSYTNGATGDVLISMYLGPGDAIGVDIEEVGFFGGNAATSALNSGVLLARALWNHNPKTGIESIVFQIDTTVS